MKLGLSNERCRNLTIRGPTVSKGPQGLSRREAPKINPNQIGGRDYGKKGGKG